MTWPPVDGDTFTIKLLREWLAPKIQSGAKIVSGRLPATPNRIVGLVPTVGPGLVMDGLFDVVSFQVSSRGGENNFDDAQAIALEIDHIFIGRESEVSVENFWMENVYVNGIGRTGSSPVTTALPDAESRWTFTCTYYAFVSTNVGQVN
jgi:hypothetical protein